MPFYIVTTTNDPASLQNSDRVVFDYEDGQLSVWNGSGWTNFLNESVVGAANAVANIPSGNSEAFPIGSVFVSVVETNPATLLGYGTWAAIGAGRMLVGFDSGDGDFDTLEETGGAKTVTLSEAQMPVHTHAQNAHGHSVSDPGHTHGQQYRNTGTAGTAGHQGASTANNATVGTTASATTGVTVQNATAVNQNAGSGQAHNNMPPYLVVRMWKRTA